MNRHGLKSNFTELQHLAAALNPLAFCPQETKVQRISESVHFLKCLWSKYSIRSSGGASILLQNYVNHSHIAIHANLQAVAFRLTLHTNITLCSIYIPHSFAVTYQDLDKLVGQLPLPYILMGTFNSHSPLWGGRHLDTKGERIEKLISVKDLCS